MVGLFHAPDGAPVHGPAELPRGRIGASVVHPPAHVGIDGHVDVADQQLTGAGPGDLILLETKIRLLRRAGWPRRQNEVPIHLSPTSLERLWLRPLGWYNIVSHPVAQT